MASFVLSSFARASFGWGFTWCGGSEFPDALPVSIQRLIVLVDVVVAVGTYERHFRCVRFASVRGVEGDQVVGFTLGHVGPAQDTASVASDQTRDLGRSGGSEFSAMPHNFASLVEDRAGDAAIAHVSTEDTGREGGTVGQGGSQSAVDHLVEGHPHMQLHPPS